MAGHVGSCSACLAKRPPTHTILAASLAHHTLPRFHCSPGRLAGQARVRSMVLVEGEPTPEKAPHLSDNELVLELDADFCSLDKDEWYGDLWWLSNMLTGEVAPVLAADDLCLTLDEAGFAFVGSAAVAVQWASDILRMSVYTTMEGEHVFVCRAQSDGGAQAIFSSRMLNSVHRREVVVPVGHKAEGDHRA